MVQRHQNQGEERKRKRKQKIPVTQVDTIQVRMDGGERIVLHVCTENQVTSSYNSRENNEVTFIGVDGVFCPSTHRNATTRMRPAPIS